MTGVRHEGRDRPGDDPKVEPDRPPVDVGQIETRAPVELLVEPSLDLPQARDPRLHGEPAAVPDVVFRDLAGRRRAGTDDAHLPAEDVPELWQLVDARFAEEGPDP